MKKQIITTVFALGSLIATPLAADTWTPPGPITLHIAFPPGGGADSQARLIAEELEARHGWNISPVNTPGKAGLIMAKRMLDDANDGTVFGLGISEALDYAMVADGGGLTPEDVSVITTTSRTEMAFTAPSGKGWTTWDDFVAAAKGDTPLRVGAMTDKIADVTYLLVREHDLNVNIATVKGGRAMINALYAGDLDAGFLAGVKAKGVKAGELNELLSGITEPLELTPDAPMLKDVGVPFDLDIYLTFFGPPDMDPEANAAIAKAIAEIVQDDTTKAGEFINTAFGGPNVVMGQELADMIARNHDAAKRLVEAASE